MNIRVENPWKPQTLFLAIPLLMLASCAAVEEDPAVVESSLSDSGMEMEDTRAEETRSIEPIFEFSRSINDEEPAPTSLNFGLRCTMEKAGQVYISGTRVGDQTESFGFRVGVTEGVYPQHFVIMDLFKGEDALESEALIQYSSDLANFPIELNGVEAGVLTMDSLEPCEGSFSATLVNAAEERVEMTDGYFLISLENERK